MIRSVLKALAATLIAASPMVVAAPARELSGLDDPASLVPTAEQVVRRAAALAASAATAARPAATPGDASSYRFNMTQNGRRMTAEEFDAWMKARGIRVATGRPTAPAANASAAPAGTAPASSCQPTAGTTC